jgi:tetratricopeptide (TPR) repeat protein
LALVLLAKKDFDTAQTAFQNALKYKTVNTADAYNNIGVILALRADRRAAEKKFETALRESGGNSSKRKIICNSANFTDKISIKIRWQSWNSAKLNKREIDRMRFDFPRIFRNQGD